jgi:hypothetical protein
MRITATLIFILTTSSAFAAEQCFYTNGEGTFVTTDTKGDVPEQYRDGAKCSAVRKRTPKNFFEKPVPREEMPRPQVIQIIPQAGRPKTPDQIALGRSQRERKLRTALGEAHFRWESSAEKYFGKSAEQTVLSAMRAASRVLAQKSFPVELRNENYNWKIVIMDKVPAEADIQINGQGVCHPAWMRPPANIFLAGERIATQCGRRKHSIEKATRLLEEALVHEIGHAVEFKFLGRRFRQYQRWHNEGFATWFESLAASYMSGRGKNRNEMRQRVRQHWDPKWNPSQFNGSWKDYSRSYALISTIAEKRSVRHLQQVYRKAASKNMPLLRAVEEDLHWDLEKYYKNVSNNFELR